MNDKFFSVKACVGIVAIVGGVSCGIVALFAIFSPENLTAAGWVVGPLCFMGVALGYLSTKDVSN